MKKKVIAVAAVSLAVSSFLTCIVYGGIRKTLIDAQLVYNADVNGDGKVDITDLNIVKNIILKNEKTDDENQPDIKDENNDDELTILCWNNNDILPMMNLFCEKTGIDPSRINIKNFDTYGGYAPEMYKSYLSNSTYDADLMFLEPDWGHEFINDDTATIPLSDIGFSEGDFENLYPYILDLGKSTITGDLKAVSWMACPGTYCYRADLADEYLGVKTPDEMQSMVDDWDKFLQTANKLKSRGGPSIAATLSGVELAYSSSRSTAWVDGSNRLVVDDFDTGYMNYARTLWDNNYVTKVYQWSDEWLPLGQTDDIMGYFVPTWGINDVILINAAGGEGGATYGKWLCIPGPNEYYWGGTWVAPTARCNNKALAKKFIEFFTVNQESAEEYSLRQGLFMSNKKVMEKIIFDRKYCGAGVLGGQNEYEVFDKVASNINLTGRISPYDALVKMEFQDAVRSYCVGETATVSEALDDYMNNVAGMIAELDWNR